MKLTELQIKKAQPKEKVYRLFDGHGLHIEITPKGQKWWRYKYLYNGKEKRMSLGVYPEISLKEARDRHMEERLKLAKGIDPSAARKVQKQQTFTSKTNTFEALGREWFETYKKGVTEGQSTRVIRRLDRDIFPFLGKLPIQDIKVADIKTALDRMTQRGVVESAHRALQNIHQILQLALITERIDRNVATNLSSLLPAKQVKHFAAITDPKRVGELMRMIEGYQGNIITIAALKIMPLVFVRSLELRQARWSDINLEEGMWKFTISKTTTEHAVPLSKQAINILKDLLPYTQNRDYVFYSDVSTKRFLSENTLASALRKLGVPKEEMSVHGFRAMARTLCHERLGIRPEVIEHQLGHNVPDALGQAYNRTRFIDDRIALMQRWADYLDQLKQD
jgi:integrase